MKRESIQVAGSCISVAHYERVLQVKSDFIVAGILKCKFNFVNELSRNLHNEFSSSFIV